MTLATTFDTASCAHRPAQLPRRGRGAAAVALLLALPLVGSRSALAQPPQGDRAAADALFQEARKLVKAGDYTAACPKFEASFALYPSAGTMLNIGDCHKQENKLATAWGDYRRAIVLIREAPGSMRQEQEDAAMKEISALEPRLPKLRLVISRPPAGLKVLRDGKELPVATLGEALVADPGPHEVRASAPGYPSVTRSVTLEEGKTATVEISFHHERETLTPALPEKDKLQGGAPAWAWVTGGVGLALTVSAVYFLIDDLAAISALGSKCHTNAAGTFCDAGYDYQHDNARKNRDLALSLGFGGASVIALGVATFGLVRASPSKRPGAPPSAMAVSPWIAHQGAGATLSGAF
jgi:PEGA domain